MGGVAIGPIIVVLLVVAALVLLFIAIQGMSLKWSVYLVGANPIGFWYGTLTAFVMGLAGGITSIGVMIAFDVQHQGILFAYSVTAAVIVLALMVRCNPLEAILAYICHALISTFLGTAVAGAAVVLLMIAVSSKAIELPEIPPAMLGNVHSSWAGDSSASGPSYNATATSVGGAAVQSNPFGS